MSRRTKTPAELGEYFATTGAWRISSMYRAATGMSSIARVLREDSIGPDCRDDYEPLSQRDVVGLLEAIDGLSDYIAIAAERLGEFGGFEAYSGDRVPDREVQE